MRNRSVPTDTVLPHVVYRDVAEALVWLTKTFGFTEHYRYGEPGGPPQGAQIHLGDAWVMLERARPASATPAQLGKHTQYLTIFVDDVATHFDKVKAAGANITEELNETVYGERQFVAQDLDGHLWLFSQHVRDMSPDEWGAIIADQPR
jgi:uncharacterized glyoxalase superfamily protein PhnB